LLAALQLPDAVATTSIAFPLGDGKQHAAQGTMPIS
jgi:hypothetical protein